MLKSQQIHFLNPLIKPRERDQTDQWSNFSQQVVIKLYDISLVRPAILPPTIITTMKFLMTKVLRCFQVMEDVYIALLIPATIPIEIAEVIIVVMMV